MVSIIDSEYYVGDQADLHKGLLRIEHPMEHGIVKSWQDMEKIWNYTYKCLNATSEEVKFQKKKKNE